MKIEGKEFKTALVDNGRVEMDVPYLSDELKSTLVNIVDIIKRSSTEYIIARDTAGDTAGDVGSCCLGMGIKVPVINVHGDYTNLMIVRGFTQGNISNWMITKPILDYLKSFYPQLNAFYAEGVMD